jgi:ADP-ribose pyrophosphatase YjhB (NUDIX family)
MGVEHHSSVALVEADQALLLEARPDLPGQLHEPGMVGLFGGGQEPGETPEQCMRRELTEEIVTPSGTDQDITSLEHVWTGQVGKRQVSLFVARLACRADQVRVHPKLEATGTGIVRLPFDQYPVEPTTMFALRALVAHSTGDYRNL